MKVYFMFRPCKSDNAYKLVPKGDLDRRMLVQGIVTKLGGKIVADTNFLTVLQLDKAKVSVSRGCEIVIRDVKSEGIARDIAKEIMELILE